MRKPTGVGRGGRRAGAGRPRGSKTKIYRPHAEKVLAAIALTPLAILIDVMRRHYEAKHFDEAARVAALAAPYVHPRLASTALTVKPSLFQMFTEASNEELAEFTEEARRTVDLTKGGLAGVKPKGSA
jgi:hypothetical protein